MALRLAESNGFALLNADSRQMVRGMRIGTAAPSDADCSRVPHHLFSCVSPREALSPRRYREMALAAIAQESRPMLAVGGSGLYLKELLQPMAVDRGEVPAALRAEAETRVREQGPATVHAWLLERDPEGMLGVHPSDAYRITKRLEHHLWLGTSYAQNRSSGRDPAFAEVPVFVLNCPRAELHARIAARLDTMLASGWLDEVRTLIAELGPTWRDAPGMQAVGYRELGEYLTENLTQPEPTAAAFAATRETILARTRQYAKKQIAFFKSQISAPLFSCSVLSLETYFESIQWNWSHLRTESVQGLGLSG